MCADSQGSNNQILGVVKAYTVLPPDDVLIVEDPSCRVGGASMTSMRLEVAAFDNVCKTEQRTADMLLNLPLRVFLRCINLLVAQPDFSAQQQQHRHQQQSISQGGALQGEGGCNKICNMA